MGVPSAPAQAPLPEVRGRVPGPAHPVVDGGHVGIEPIDGSVPLVPPGVLERVVDPQLGRVSPGDEPGPARRARRTCDVELPKQGALAHEPIAGRRPSVGVPEAAGVAEALVVGEDDEDVGRCGVARLLRTLDGIGVGLAATEGASGDEGGDQQEAERRHGARA